MLVVVDENGTSEGKQISVLSTEATAAAKNGGGEDTQWKEEGGASM